MSRNNCFTLRSPQLGCAIVSNAFANSRTSQTDGRQEMALDTGALRALGWQDPPQHTMLSTGEVQLWLVKVPDAHLSIDALLARLTPAERERAAAKRITAKHREYVAGQASLRTLLAKQLDLDPMQIAYQRGVKGKPYLSGSPTRGGDQVQFNISHSGEMVMVAMALDTELGVDVEWYNERTDPLRVARRAFSAGERETLAKTPARLQRAHFFAMWTCKEALVKCTGMGIHSGMANFEIELDGSESGRVSAAWDTQNGVDRLCVVPLKLAAGGAHAHAGALVHEPPTLTVRRWILDASPDPLRGF
jgi:4'-phosphopantetheinyl transferase